MDTVATEVKPVTEPCHCPAPNSECRRANGREMIGRLWELCQTSEAHRQHWDRQPTFPPVATTRPKPCRHLWKRVRDEAGAVVTREAATTCCGKKALDVFECRCPARLAADSAHDQVTLSDCHACLYRPRIPNPGARALILKNNLCPGDVLAMTAAVYSLHRAHPGQFVTAVETTADALWEHNPDVVSVSEARALQGEEVQMHYPLVDQSNQRAIHFLQAYCDFLEHALKVRIPLLTNKPILYLSRQEKEWLGQVEEAVGRKIPYWVINAGRKDCYTTKFYGSEQFQKVVDLLRGRVQFVQAGAAEHHHPSLKNVINFVGRTDQRQLVRLVYHAQGVLTGVSFVHHLAAALDKPCVTILGGREPVQWNSYARTQLLHTIGSLACCRDGGCWKSRVVPLGDGDKKDEDLCRDPVLGEEPVPRCMALIKPEEVAGKILLTASHP